ncbi:hypothetical protein ACJX0J_038392, partial [Zea mays]
MKKCLNMFHTPFTIEIVILSSVTFWDLSQRSPPKSPSQSEIESKKKDTESCCLGALDPLQPSTGLGPGTSGPLGFGSLGPLEGELQIGGDHSDTTLLIMEVPPAVPLPSWTMHESKRFIGLME